MSIEVIYGPRSLRFSSEGRLLTEQDLTHGLFNGPVGIGFEDAKETAARIFDAIEEGNQAEAAFESLELELEEANATVAQHENEIIRLESVNKVLNDELVRLRAQLALTQAWDKNYGPGIPTTPIPMPSPINPFPWTPSPIITCETPHSKITNNSQFNSKTAISQADGAD